MADSDADGESSADEGADAEGGDADPDADATIGLVEARERAMETAGQLLDHPIEGVVRIEGTNDGGWRVLVEALERSAVPDTQDIIGRYEFVVDATGTLGEYGLVERYRRGETKEEL